MAGWMRQSAPGPQLGQGGRYEPRPALGRAVGLALVILLHIGIIYALVNGLARKAIDVVRAPIETKIIDEAPQQKLEPPPPPQLATPPPPFVPPPEVRIETPAPVQSTAPTVVTPVRPVTPAPPVAAPVRVMPRLDAQHSREAEYPPVSRRLGEQGSAILQVLVGVDGRVVESRLVQSSGFDRLDQAALTEVKRRYRFFPGTVDGRPEQMWYTFRFTWKLQ